jgi:hypothetical protein
VQRSAGRARDSELIARVIVAAMRRSVSVVTLVLVAAAAFAGACAEDKGFVCQPLCAGSDGTLIGGDDTITVSAKSESDADQACVEKAADDNMACPSGDSVMRCSCDEN